MTRTAHAVGVWATSAALLLSSCARVPSPSAGEKDRVARGAEIYAVACSACHQIDGSGSEGIGPPLAGSAWVNGSPDRLLRVVLHGVRGPIEVRGKVWNQEMPAMGFFGNRDLAAVLTFIRQAWGNRAPAIAADAVAAARSDTANRVDSWTADELRRLRWTSPRGAR